MASEDLVREAQDPSTSAARLAELAQADRALWPAIAVHPAAYPGLLDWLGQQGDATVNAVLALRSGSAATPSPTEVIPTQQPVAEQPTAEQPAAEQPTTEQSAAEQPTTEQPAASPVAEPVVPSQAAQPADPAQPTVVAPAYSAPAAAPSYGSVPPGGAAPLADDTAGKGDDPGKKNFWVLAGIVAAVLVLIGGAAFGATKVFGGDDDDKDEAGTTQTTSTPETPSPDASEAPTADAPSTPSGSSSDAGGFCGEYDDLQQETLDSMGGASGSGGDLDKLTESLGDLAVAYSDLEDEAPGEIKSEVAVMADYFDTFKDPANVDPSEIEGKIKEFSTAAQKVSQYYYSNCI